MSIESGRNRSVRHVADLEPVDTSPKNVWEQVLDELRLQIVLGELASGDRLVETELAHQFGISRGPVRTSLLYLERSGLVVPSDGRGLEVLRLSDDDILDLFAVRSALEVLAIRRVAVMSLPGLPALLHSELERLSRAVADQRWVEAAEADLAFHQFICAESGNRALYEAWLNLADRMALIATRLYQRGFASQDSDGPHLAIIDGITSGDAGQAEEAIRRHFAAGQL